MWEPLSNLQAAYGSLFNLISSTAPRILLIEGRAVIHISRRKALSKGKPSPTCHQMDIAIQEVRFQQKARIVVTENEKPCSHWQTNCGCGLCPCDGAANAIAASAVCLCPYLGATRLHHAVSILHLLSLFTVCGKVSCIFFKQRQTIVSVRSTFYIFPQKISRENICLNNLHNVYVPQWTS